jgi:hypothetical protein
LLELGLGIHRRLNEPQIWEEITQMSSKKKPPVDYGPLIKYMKETNAVKRFIEEVGVKQAVEAVGVEQTLAAIGEEELLANLSPERREKLRRLLQQESTPSGKRKKG